MYACVFIRVCVLVMHVLVIGVYRCTFACEHGCVCMHMFFCMCVYMYYASVCIHVCECMCTVMCAHAMSYTLGLYVHAHTVIALCTMPCSLLHSCPSCPMTPQHVREVKVSIKSIILPFIQLISLAFEHAFRESVCVYTHACVLFATSFLARSSSTRPGSSWSPRVLFLFVSQPGLMSWSAGRRIIHMRERVISLSTREQAMIRARMCLVTSQQLDLPMARYDNPPPPFAYNYIIAY